MVTTDPIAPAACCSEAAPAADLMQSLARLVRGLSALFWGLPFALVVCVQTARTNVFSALGVVPPLVANAVLLYGLIQMGQFRKQERIWRRAVERTRLVALVNVGLSPFLYWWKVMPEVPHYRFAVLVMAVAGLLLLFYLNLALQRLTAMLPDETLRLEAHLFTNLNLGLLVAATLVLGAVGTGVAQVRPVPAYLLPALGVFSLIGPVILLLLVLLALALTMTLLWKIKETILDSVFSSRP